MSYTVESNLSTVRPEKVLRVKARDNQYFISAAEFKAGQRVQVPVKNSTNTYAGDMSDTDTNDVTYFRAGQLEPATEIKMKDEDGHDFIVVVTDREKAKGKVETTLRFNITVKDQYGSEEVSYDAVLRENGILSIGCQNYKLSSWVRNYKRIIDTQHAATTGGRWEYKTCVACNQTHSKYVTDPKPNETAVALKEFAVTIGQELQTVLTKMQRTVARRQRATV